MGFTVDIVDDGSYAYQSHPRKNYAKALLKVVPFNNYSWFDTLAFFHESVHLYKW